MRSADCGIQIEFLISILLFSIRNPKSEIPNNLCFSTPKQLAIFKGITSSDKVGLLRDGFSVFAARPPNSVSKGSRIQAIELSLTVVE
jgi:hypothetical protein